MTPPNNPEVARAPVSGTLTIVTAFKIFLGLLFLAVIMAVLMPLLVLLLPFRRTRIVLTNYAGTLIGGGLVWFSGCKLHVEGREYADGTHPVIMVGNHTSILDAFTAVWLVPPGTVGIAKKQIIYYPFFGQAWFLSGHLLIDRRNRERAVESLKKLADYVRSQRLSIMLWPEGTRSHDGRLKAFKKGFAHLALQTGLPVVPVVIQGAHKSWKKGQLRFRPVNIHIRLLPPIDTSNWTLENIEGHIAEVRQAFIDALPSDQRPLPA